VILFESTSRAARTQPPGNRDWDRARENPCLQTISQTIIVSILKLDLDVSEELYLQRDLFYILKICFTYPLMTIFHISGIISR
jgi:hypothetical protein